MENGHSNTNDIRVVLVEDHLLTRIGLRTVLERTNDIKVIGEAENGAVAVQLVRELKPDVVLMDVGMPLLDGIEAARQICAENPQQRIIMLTSHDSEQDILQLSRPEPEDIVLKTWLPTDSTPLFEVFTMATFGLTRQ
jgi:Response regulator containing a CheY-like receiver domain and an HTH DNA-binding domain